MTIRCAPITLIFSAFLHKVYIFLKYCCFLEEFNQFSNFAVPSQYHFHIIFFSAAALLRSFMEAMFNCIYLASTCHISTYWLLLDIGCPYVSLMCPIRSLLSLTLFYIQLFWVLFHSSIRGLL